MSYAARFHDIAYRSDGAVATVTLNPAGVRVRRMSRRALALAAALYVAAFANAPAAARDATAPAPPEKTFMVLSASQIDPAKLLPPPPKDHSAAQAAELDRLRQIQATRTDARLRQAENDEEHEDAGVFAEALGSRFDVARLPATRAVLDIVRNDASVAASMAKTAFHRHRPWIFDPSLVGCSRASDADPLTSYPSGSATFGYATAVVLAHLIPRRSQAIMSRASDYGYSRLVCEAHYPSDVAAGAQLGISVGALLIDAPAMRSKLAAAKAELRRSHTE